MEKVWIATRCEDLKACTGGIQQLIDRCNEAGGGQVRLTAGVYPVSTLYLKSNVELYLDAGAILLGSDNFEEYSNCVSDPVILPEIPRWYDALIAAVGQANVSISGEGLIDGVDCINPGGEQGFRGPHAVLFHGCTGIRVSGVTVVRSACYGIMLENCRDALIEHVSIRGGQDGFRLGCCKNVEIRRCDVRSGDDCLGGSGNEDVRVFDSSLNTPGSSAVLFSCLHFHMRNCKIWSTCEYPAVFRTDKRYSLCRTAFCVGHDYGYRCRQPSGDWLIEDVTLENITEVLRFERIHSGLKAIPVSSVVMQRVNAVNLVNPILLMGNVDAPTSLTIRDSRFAFAGDDPECKGVFLRAERFDTISLENVRLSGCGAKPIECRDGQSVKLSNVTLETALTTDNADLSGVGATELCADAAPTTASRYVTPGVTSVSLPKDASEAFRGPVRFIP